MTSSSNKKNKQLPQLLENLPVGVYRTSPDGKIITANKTLIHMLGYQNFSELENINVKDLYVKSGNRKNILKKLETAKICFARFEIRCKDGRTFWCRDYSKSVLDDKGKIVFTDGTLIDISTEKKTEDKLKKALRQLAHSNKEREKMIAGLENLTLEDPLTGLYNRRGFTTIAKEYLQLANRNKMDLYLLYIDLDDLKKINDTFGHNKGDFILVALAEILQKTFRKSDIKARIGGDEFAVFPIDSHKKGVDSALVRFTKNIDEYNNSTGHQPLLSVSTGVSCYSQSSPCTVNELLTLADSLMYEEKRSKQKT
ncbi:MAG: diguanylate cyclase [Candidatus Aminicenantes bacterium]|nr:diguanylate cyclase [Candidatus Aminicenantes bacterium]